MQDWDCMIRIVIIGVCLLVSIIAQGVRLGMQRSALVVRDQPIGDTFVIDQVRTQEPAVLAVVYSIYGKPKYGYIVDQIDLPRAGTYINVQASIDPNDSLISKNTPNDDRIALSSGSLVYAVLMRRDASGMLLPMRDIFGKPLSRPFWLL